MRARLVPHTGFEPVISALRGRCPGPLDECGTATTAVDAVAGAKDTSDPAKPQPCGASEAVRLEEHPDRLGDLLMTLLAGHEAEMRVRPKGLVLCAEPLGQPLR